MKAIQASYFQLLVTIHNLLRQYLSSLREIPLFTAVNMNFALIIALLSLAASVHQYICDDSTYHEDFQTSFLSQQTRNPPPFPNLSVTKKNKMMPTKPHSITLLYLLAQAGDLHPNPGPNPSITQTPAQNYPCGSCRHDVHDQFHAIQCDECDLW